MQLSRTAPDVAIIGGGYAGMAAAVALADNGVRVTVYEAARQLGGRARRVDRQQFALDNGQHILIGAYRDTLALIQRVGTPEARLWRHPLLWSFPPHFALRIGTRLPAPYHLAYGLMRARGLSIGARLQCVRFFDWCKRRAFRLTADEPLAVLLHEHHQHAQAIRFLWQPLCMAALNTPIERASSQVFLNVLRDSLAANRTACDLILPRTDLSDLFPAAAGRYIERHRGSIHLATAVSRIDRDGARFAVTTHQRRTEHAAIVIATQPSHVASLVSHLPQLSEPLRRIDALSYQSIVTVYLRYSRNPDLPFPLVGMSGRYGQWLFDRSQINDQPGVVAVVISAYAREQKMSHAALGERVRGEVAEMLPHLSALKWMQVVEEKQATFSCIPGLTRPDQRTAVPGLFLAGDYTASDYPATLEAAVRSGLRCAVLAMDHFKA